MHFWQKASGISVFVGLAICAIVTKQAGADDTIDFNRDIRPILSNNCYLCHGFDEEGRQADLRLDHFDAATAQREDGSVAIVPHDATKSLVMERIATDDADLRMPPPDSGKSLSPQQIELLRRWIDSGAQYDQHWSFVAPVRPELPTIKNRELPRNAIDYFVLHRLDREGLAPSPAADKHTLIRRVALDVTGLPPTLAEQQQFLADTSPDAYEKMVDRYLASPHYGEQMAREWLDLARYADTNGYQYDLERQQWVWRDWVIWAFNQNMPFDQFTIKQLAGDLLPDATPLDRLATGFNRNHPITIEGGVIDEEYRTEYVMDRLTTTGTTWLGLTLGCARCHDHKYDPISQREFYQLFAFFNQVPEKGLNGFDPKEKIPSPLAAGTLSDLQTQLAALEQAWQDEARAQDAAIAKWEVDRQTQPANQTWQVLIPKSAGHVGGKPFQIEGDGSVLASDPANGNNIFVIESETTLKQMTAIRLEALTHPSLPGGGPGRFDNSNFVLSGFEATAISLKDSQQQQPVTFTRAVADYEQTGYPIAAAIDANPQSGWAVDGPTKKEPRVAVFFADKPFGYVGGTRLVVRLRFESQHPRHTMGRPRLSVTEVANPDLGDGVPPTEIVAILETAGSARTPTQQDQLRHYFLRTYPTPKAFQLQAQLDELRKEIAALTSAAPDTMIMRELPKPRATHILKRGEYDKLDEPVSPGVPSVFPPLPTDVPANRLALAKWLVDPQHPLTSRVAVNRLWQQIFGTGLVKTSEDFGLQGESPSHPELLDWLATEFISSGWDQKQLLKLMLTSATYRQSSNTTPELLERDPENLLLARGPRLRLSAETIRDQALFAAGLFNATIGGRSVYPYHPQGLWMEINNRPGYSKEYVQDKGDKLYRRSLYTFWKRTVPPPSMATFDAPEREYCVVRRSRTNTPLQAFVLLHDPQFVEAARHLAQKMMLEGGGTFASRLQFGFTRMLARNPSDAEQAVFQKIYDSRLAMYRQDPNKGLALLAVGDSPRDQSLDVPEFAAWTTVAQVMLNLSETVTKN
jgi:hypothetical protein